MGKKKRRESEGFEQIVDFLNAHPIKYALTVNPTIYTSCIEQFWSTVKAKTINGEVQLHALVDDEAVHKELGDSLIRAATTASSLEAEQDSDEDITLVNVQDDTDNEMFDMDALMVEGFCCKKLLKDYKLSLMKRKRLAREKDEANVALTEEWDDIQAKIEADHELAQRLQAEEQEELSDAENATLFQQLLDKRRNHFAAKRAEEQRNKPPTQAQQ
ncbi:hypothetical protein Tco_0526775 [Tanacetum coccineum]